MRKTIIAAAAGAVALGMAGGVAAAAGTPAPPGEVVDVSRD
jgi:hypothetical protein